MGNKSCSREFSHRSLIVKASGSYHGVDAWCDPGKGGEFRRIVPIYLNLTGTI